MFSDNKNADNSRLEAESGSPEVKLNLGRRAASYGVSRLIDRPNIGRRNRRGRRGLDIDIPTGGVPGSREPTGSRLDIDRDGWADEGTKKPVWVGFGNNFKKPKLKNRNFSSRLSSGSGSKKLTIINQNDERIAELQKYLDFDLQNPYKDSKRNANVAISSEVRELTSLELFDRHQLNPFRFVEFNEKGKKKKLYLLATSHDGGRVAAFDIDKLISSAKAKESKFDLDYKYFLGELVNIDSSRTRKANKSIVGTLLAAEKKITRLGKYKEDDKPNWEIYSVEVKKNHQRKGLGSALLKMHRDTWPELGLDHSETLSDDGAGFAKATPVERLSSGVEKPKYPRGPRYGAIIDGALDVFGEAKTWQEFKEIYDNEEIVFLDYETTGLVMDQFKQPSGNGRPIQLALVKMKGGKVIDKLDIFMNPEEPLGDWSKANLRGPDGKPLSDEWLKTQMSISEAHKKAAEFIGDRIIGVQNSAFDKDVLDDALGESGISWRPMGYLDTQEFADMVLPKWSPETQDGPYGIDSDGNKYPSVGLANITKYLNVDLGDKHHYATHDAEAAGMVMSAIINGSIQNGWSADVLDETKRIQKIQKDRDSFNKKVKQFNIDKEQFLTNNKPNNQERLSSGAERRRPVIKMTAKEVEKIKEHRQRKYKYGDISVLDGKPLRRDRNNWLSGLTPEQMAELLVPTSEEERFDMWLDDFAPGAKESKAILESFKKYWDEYTTKQPWDQIDTTPESIQLMKETLVEALNSNPYMRWAFENHGSPMFAVWHQKGHNAYHSRPEVFSKMNEVAKSRNSKTIPTAAGRVSPYHDLVLFSEQQIKTKKSSYGDDIAISHGPNHVVKPGAWHIDDSYAGMIMHEWGHWLHYRAIRDYDGLTKQSNRAYYGSGNKNDPSYVDGLEIAQEYRSWKHQQPLMKLFEDNAPMENNDGAPRTTTSYAHISLTEMIAEGISAVLHPNQEIPKTSINTKLRRDVEKLLGGDGEFSKPWLAHAEKEHAIFRKRINLFKKNERKERLSSARADVFGVENQKLKNPMFLKPATEREYIKGKSPKPDILRREIYRDMEEVKNLEDSYFNYIDDNGTSVEVYGPNNKQYEAHKYVFAKLISDSLNFDAEEMLDELGEMLGEIDISERNLYIYSNPAVYKQRTSNTKKRTRQISDFYGMKPSGIVEVFEGFGDVFVEFDLETSDGQNALKTSIVKNIMEQWQISSSTPASRLLQVAAKQLFGVKASEYSEKYNELTPNFTEKQQDIARQILSSMHGLTQSYFRSKGISHVSLYRGLAIRDEQTEKQIKGDSLPIDTYVPGSFYMTATSGNSLSSWTSDLDIAEVMSLPESVKYPIVVKQIVPVNDVIGHFLFNFGTYGESEFVVLGKTRPTIVFEVPKTIEDIQNIDKGLVKDFLSRDDEDFYAYSRLFANKLRADGDQELANTIDNFANDYDTSVERLSSGRIARVKESMKKAYSFTVGKFRIEPDAEKQDRTPNWYGIVPVIAEDENVGFVEPEINSPESVGVVSPNSSIALAADVIRDSAKIINLGPGMYEPLRRDKTKELQDMGINRGNTDVHAKRAVAELLAEMTDADIEEVLKIFHTSESILEMFPEEHREQVRQALSQGIDDIEFGIDDDSENANVTFDEFIKQNPIYKVFPERIPKTIDEMRLYLSDMAYIKELVRRLKTGDVASDEDYKFRMHPDSGEILGKSETEFAAEISNVNVIRDRLIRAMLRIADGQDGSARPEQRLMQLWPNVQAAIKFLNDGRFESLDSKSRIHALAALERMVDDFFVDETRFQEDEKRDGGINMFPYSKIPNYQKKQLYKILTEYGGLTDEEMRMLGYYEDNNDFQNMASAAIEQINGSGFLFQKRANRPFSISNTRTGDAWFAGENDRHLEFEPVFNIPYWGGEERDDSEIIPNIADVNDAASRSGIFSSAAMGNAATEWEYLIKSRRKSLLVKLRYTFGKNNEPKNRKLRIMVSEDPISGNRIFHLEDASIDPKESLLATWQKHIVQGKKIGEPKLISEINLSDSEEIAAEQVDEIMSKHYFETRISDLLRQIRSADGFYGDADKNKQIADTSDFDVSKLKRSQFRYLVDELTNTEELDIRTPEGRKAIMQKLMSDIVRSWALSSNKVFLSTIMQEVAGEEFGIKEPASMSVVLPENTKDDIGIFGVIKKMIASGQKLQISDSNKKVAKEVLRTMHDATQEYFKSKGITHITIYRGMNVKPNDIPDEVKTGQVVDLPIQMRPLSSWSSTPKMAERFGGADGFSGMSGQPNMAGVVLGAVVPVEDVLAIPLTGFGCLNEDEVVLIGKPRNAKMMLTPNAWVESRLMGKSRDSSDWPSDMQKYRPYDDELKAEAKTEAENIRQNFKNLLQDDAVKITEQKLSEDSFNERLSSGAINNDRRYRITFDRQEIEKRTRSFAVEYDRNEDREGISETLKKAFEGGYTVDVDVYSDIKEGISVARNEHGIILAAGQGFDPDGNPEPWLVDMFLNWLRLHGREKFNNPKEGATRVALGGWREEKTGKVYLDIVDIYPETPEFLGRAYELGNSEDQKEVALLKKLWAAKDGNGKFEDAFIKTGGRGGRTISVKSLRDFEKARRRLLERVRQTGSPDLIPVGKPMRIELKGHKNMRRARLVDPNNLSMREFIFLDSDDGLSVVAYSGEQLDRAIDDTRSKNITAKQLQKLVESEQPIARLVANRGLGKNELVYSFIKNNEQMFPTMVDALKHMHRQFNVGSQDKENLRLSSGRFVSLHPDTNPQISSNGIGAIPGDENGILTSMLPISLVKQYIEFDRAGKDRFGSASEEIIANIERYLRNGGGIREPLWIYFDPKIKWGYLSEGHHRLIAAERAGMTHVPVTIYQGPAALRKERGVGAPLQMVYPNMFHNNERDTYIPSTMNPGLFAQLQNDDDEAAIRKWAESEKREYRLSSGRKVKPKAKKSTRKSSSRTVKQPKDRKPPKIKTISNSDPRVKPFVDRYGSMDQVGTLYFELREDDWWERLKNKLKDNPSLLTGEKWPDGTPKINGEVMNARMMFNKAKFIEYTHPETGKKHLIALVNYNMGHVVAIDVNELKKDMKDMRAEFTSWDKVVETYMYPDKKRFPKLRNFTALVGWIEVDRVGGRTVVGYDRNNNEIRKSVKPGFYLTNAKVKIFHRNNGLAKEMLGFHNEVYPELETSYMYETDEERRRDVDIFSNWLHRTQPENWPEVREWEAEPTREQIEERLSSGLETEDAKTRNINELIISDAIDDYSNYDTTKRNVVVSFKIGDDEFTAKIMSEKNGFKSRMFKDRDVGVIVKDKNGRTIGFMHATRGQMQESTERITIADISVDDEYQRRGLATTMMRLGAKYNVDQEKIYHSEMLSKEGKLFAEATPESRLSSGSNETSSKSIDDFVASENLKKAIDILEKEIPDGDLFQKIASLREKDFSSVIIEDQNQDTHLTEEETKFINAVVAVGTLLAEALQKEIDKITQSGGKQGELFAKRKLLKELELQMLSYGPIAIRASKKQSSMKPGQAVSILAEIYGVSPTAPHLKKIIGEDIDFSQIGAEKLIKLLKKYEKPADYRVREVPWRRRIPKTIETNVEYFGEQRQTKHPSQIPVASKTKLVIHTDKKNTKAQDDEQIEFIKQQLPAVGDILQVLSIVQSVFNRNANTSDRQLETKENEQEDHLQRINRLIDKALYEGHELTDEEILSFAEFTTIRNVFDRNHQSLIIKDDGTKTYPLPTYPITQNRDGTVSVDAVVFKEHLYNEKQGISTELTTEQYNRRKEHLVPQHKFDIVYNPITKGMTIILVRDDSPTVATSIEQELLKVSDEESIISAEEAELLLSYAISRRSAMSVLSDDDAKDLFISTFREVLNSKKVKERSKESIEGAKIDEDITVNGKLFPKGTKLNDIRNELSLATLNRDILIKEIKKLEENAIDSPIDVSPSQTSGEIVKTQAQIQQEIVVDLLKAIGVEFTEPDSVPIHVAQLKPMQPLARFMAFFQRGFDGERLGDENQINILRSLRDGNNNYEYNKPNKEGIINKLKQAVSLIPKIFTDGSLQYNIRDTEYVRNVRESDIKDSGESSVPLKLVYRVVPRLQRAHATSLRNGATMITESTPEESKAEEYISTIIHETVHGIENANPILKVLQWMYWHSRRKPGEKIKQIKSMSRSGRGYEEYEIGIEDEWKLPYSGKIYTRGTPISNFEILTTGFEGLFVPTYRKDVTEDNGLMAFTLGVLALGRTRPKPKTTNTNENEERLSSGAVYQSLVEGGKDITDSQMEAISEIEELITNEEFKNEDKTKITKDEEFGIFDESSIDDSPQRIEAKQKLGNAFVRAFDGELTLENDVVITAKNGEKVNLGKKFIVVSNVNSINIEKPSEIDINEAKRELYAADVMSKTKLPYTKIDITMKIQPLDNSANQRLIDAGIPQHTDGSFDIIDDFDLTEDSKIILANANRSIFVNDKAMFAIHDSIKVGKSAQGFGMGSLLNARNENIYEALGLSSIFTMGQSSEYASMTGATHWARNGFTWAGEPSKQKFIQIIDDAINLSGDFTEEEKQRISALYKKNTKTGLFESSATPEELVDFAMADLVFQRAEASIYFRRDLSKNNTKSKLSSIRRRNRRNRRISRNASERLSSGSEPTRTIGEKLLKGPKNLENGYDDKGLPKIESQETLRQKYGSTASQVAKYFKTKYGINLEIKFDKREGESDQWIAVYSAANAMEDVFQNIELKDLIEESLRTVKFQIGPQKDTESQWASGVIGFNDVMNKNIRFKILTDEAVSAAKQTLSIIKNKDSSPEKRKNYLSMIERYVPGKVVVQLDDSEINKENIIARLTYATTIHEFGHLLDTFARIALPPDNRKPITDKDFHDLAKQPLTDEQFKKGRQRLRDILAEQNYFTAAFGMNNQQYQNQPSLTAYGSRHSTERTAEAFAAWWFFRQQKLKVFAWRPSKDEEEDGVKQGIETDISVIANIILKPLFDALGRKLKSDNRRTTEILVNSRRPENSPMVQLFALFPYITITES